jgi:uncharacterized membrane protein YdbT with pleckstrin-like domain
MPNAVMLNNVAYQRLHPSTAYCFASIAGWLFAALLCFAAAFWINLFALPALVLLGIALYRFLYTRNILYLINEEMIKIRTGIFGFRISTLELYRVKDYIVLQPLYMRIFNIMTLKLLTTDSSTKSISLSGIPISDVPDRIRNYVQIARSKSRIVELN